MSVEWDVYTGFMTTTEDPTSGLLREAVNLVRELAGAPRGNLVSLKSQAEAYVLRYDADLEERSVIRRHRMAPDRAADQWILDIFSATEAAISREQLVAEFVVRYAKERKVGQSQSGANGPWLFVFEWESADAGPHLVPHSSLGVHPHAFETLCKQWLPQASDDAFLYPVMFEDTDLDGYHSLWFGGSPLFDQLLDTRRHFRGESDYWVNAVALRGPSPKSGLGVFILYPNAGTLEDPVPPSNMRQDQRLLVVLALAWRQLEHQIKALARLSEENRREFIQLLAPGLIHHEIGAEMHSLYGQANSLYRGLRGWAQAAPERQDLIQIANSAYAVGQHAHRLFAITNAFNNLDKRAQVEDTTMGDVCESLRVLLHHRLGELGIDLALAPELHNMALHTDAVLLTQALLNIVNNALNALSEGATPAPRRVVIWPIAAQAAALKSGLGGGQRVGIQIANNGPAIPAQDSVRVFQRGVTTRKVGHGQGLYLVRVVAHYLGGEVSLMETNALPEGLAVGFRFTLLRRLAAESSVSHGAET